MSRATSDTFTIPEHTLNLCVTGRGERGRSVREGRRIGRRRSKQCLPQLEEEKVEAGTRYKIWRRKLGRDPQLGLASIRILLYFTEY